MEKIKTVVIGKGAYNAADISGQSWEQFKADADKQTEATKGKAWFGAWGDQREAKLKEVYEAAVSAMKPKASATDTSDIPPPGEGGGKPGKAMGAKTT